MSAYIITSVITGFIGSAYGLVAYGSGVWTMLGWYMLGGWAGIGLAVVAVLTMSIWRETSLDPLT
ncbi:MAG: hypothetical protein AB3N13_01150 [Arenibacterium sp.]